MTSTPTDRNLPPAGWSGPDRRGMVTFTMHGSSIMVEPPAKEGYEPFFIARNGEEYTRWTYKPVNRPASTPAQGTAINAIVYAYENVRKKVYAAIEADLPENLKWLRTAFRNAGADGITSIDARPNGVYVNGECWTNQTGGSVEHWETVVPYDRL